LISANVCGIKYGKSFSFHFLDIDREKLVIFGTLMILLALVVAAIVFHTVRAGKPGTAACAYINDFAIRASALL
jgi:hypothetical protein